MSRDPELCRAFVSCAKRLLADYPEIAHSWSIDADEDHCILDIPKAAADGFDITVEVDPGEITVFCEGFHDNYPLAGSAAEFAGHLAGLLYDLLSPLMRIRERLSNGSACQWTLERLEGDSWHLRGTTGLVFFNYFGKRTETIYQNRRLPLRPEN